MNRVICVKGHFYDGDKYEACPHCAAGAEAIRQDPFSVRHSELEEEKIKGRKNEGKTQHDKRGFFRRKGKGSREEETNPEISAVQQTVLLQENVSSEMQRQKPEQKTDIAETGQGAAEPGVSISQESVSQSLSAAFSASSRTDETVNEGKTVGYFSTGRTEPPVGYLICTAGEDYGRGFPLKTGNNSVGRSVSMDVVIMDEKVSREKQAFVMYEPLKREFYMKPGEGTGLCYLNGELVLGPVKMKAFDMIMLGDTKLILIPVCCERFSWEEVK